VVLRPNHWQTVPVILRLNHWQTVHLSFEAQPRNLLSSSPRAWCRPHTASPEISIVWPPSSWPMWPSPVLCIRSPTPSRSSLLPTIQHMPPAHHETSKRDSPNDTKIKVKPKCPGFEFKPHQVNDLSQSNQGTDPLVSQSLPWWVHWQQKHKVWSLNPKPHEAQLEDQKAKKSSRWPSRRRKTAKANKRQEKRQSQAKWQRRAKKSSKLKNSNSP
jgi:hypothetical protein